MSHLKLIIFPSTAPNSTTVQYVDMKHSFILYYIEYVDMKSDVSMVTN